MSLSVSASVSECDYSLRTRERVLVCAYLKVCLCISEQVSLRVYQDKFSDFISPEIQITTLY